MKGINRLGGSISGRQFLWMWRVTCGFRARRTFAVCRDMPTHNDGACGRGGVGRGSHCQTSGLYMNAIVDGVGVAAAAWMIFVAVVLSRSS